MRYFCYICSEFPNSCAIVSTAPAICLYMCLRKHDAKIWIICKYAMNLIANITFVRI